MRERRNGIMAGRRTVVVPAPPAPIDPPLVDTGRMISVQGELNKYKIIANRWQKPTRFRVI
jgi:hypothetical protein